MWKMSGVAVGSAGILCSVRGRGHNDFYDVALRRTEVLA